MKINDKDITVSIQMLAYNHEKYIAKAIESVIMQETDFKYELVIGEDCSTDNTRQIILEYKKKYPDKIKLLLHKNNIGMSQNGLMTMKACIGTYLAICEGDDYWTNPKKLQYQLEQMRQHPSCHISFHPSIVIDNETIREKVAGRHLNGNTIFDIQSIIKGGGGFCPTASLIIKKEVIQDLPAFFLDAPVGDYLLQILGSMNGGALYIDKTMSAYRIHSTGVWSSIKDDFEKRKAFAIAMSTTVHNMDKFYNLQFHEEFMFFISRTFLGILTNKTFPIYDRIALYTTCKDHLTIEQQMKQQQLFIDEQMRMIKNKKKSFNQLQLEIEEKNDNLKIIFDSIQKVIQFSIISSPLKKYKAYKIMTKIYHKLQEK